MTTHFAIVVALFSSLTTVVVLGASHPELIDFGGSEHQMSYADLAMIILAAVTVMLAIFALIAAIAAFIGFDYLKKKLVEAAENKAEITTKEVATIVAETRVSELSKTWEIVDEKAADDFAKAFDSPNEEKEP